MPNIPHCARNSALICIFAFIFRSCIMEKFYEFAIVGSGPAASMAAQTLMEAGREVLVLDAGVLPDFDQNLIPPKDFLSVRQQEDDQQALFLGHRYETLNIEKIKPAAQLTPPRSYMTKGVDTILPVLSDSFKPVESLAYGGLGVGWGLGCYVYSDAEIEKTGLPLEPMREAYNVVSRRIGITSTSPDLLPYIAQDVENLLKPLLTDNSAEVMLKKAAKSSLNSKGFHFGLPAMAILTEPLEDRAPSSYFDMDFYSDAGYSCWRPWMTFNKLRKYDNLHYIPDQVVLSFENDNDKVIIYCKDLKTNKKSRFAAKKVLLGAGALGNARILLRSDKSIDRLPLLSNPYVYMPCLHWSMLGKPLQRFKTSMAQAMMIYDEDRTNADLVSLAFYTYRSLLLHRLIPMLPFSHQTTLRMLNYLQSAFMIAGIHHPDVPSETKYLSLAAASNTFTDDILTAHYAPDAFQIKQMFRRERKIRSALRRLGCFPLKRIDPGYGGSIHYGGTIPFSDQGKIGTQLHDGSIFGYEQVKVLDASGFNFLPAKGVTLSIMANAHRVTLNALNAS